jgi:hypothetical protein
METTIRDTVMLIEPEMIETTPYLRKEEAKTATPNRLANLWLIVLSIILGTTLTCTGILVAWPILAFIGSRFL